ncbi:MAG: formylglycine-generating enzyme family protein [Planctomycetota bacterium]
MDERLRELLREVAGAPDAGALVRIARDLERNGELPAAANAYDAAFGLEPEDAPLAAARAQVLDALAVEELGIAWRYVPAGSFLMGSAHGDPDERPVHAVELDAFWIADVPISWERYHALAGWPPPPEGWPNPDGAGLRLPRAAYWAGEEHKVRGPFCDDDLQRASDWRWDRPGSYATKPVVAVTWSAVTALGAHLSGERWIYRLPTEAEWEKAARGGRVGARYAWGDAPPTPECCDCDALERRGIRPSRATPANGYGLHAMCGGVWEWTGDLYDATWYSRSPRADEGGPREGEERVIRGGSWADAPAACTVSFRASCVDNETHRGGGYLTPNLGFRLVRVPRGR